MLVTLLGIVTEVKEEQYMKASSPILVTLSGIIILPSAFGLQATKVVFVES
jgi:hypothetical protein